jgi:hypothetical protein
MTERPILFQGAMVRAILDGSKTQTRRVVKPVGNDGGFVLVEQKDGTLWPHRSDDGESCFVTRRERDGDYLDDIPMRCPYGQPGDRLWVREAWRVAKKWDGTAPRDLPPRTMTVEYEVGGYACNSAFAGGQWTASEDNSPREHPEWVGKLRPSMFMPRWASRITLEITGVRVERLQDISEADSQAEGCAPAWLDADDNETVHADAPPTYRQGYARLWRDINGPGSWGANPWVWVYEFSRSNA